MASIARLSKLLPLYGLVALIGVGCDKTEPDETQPPPQEPASSETQAPPELKLASLEAWKLGEQTLNQSLESSRKLHRQMEDFLLTPDAETLTKLRQRWHQAHNQWHRLDPFLALTGSNPGLFGGMEKLATGIDAQPIQPGYLDYLEHYPHTGIVNDITLAINAQTLRAQHGLTDASDVSLGFHALEFLLWGEHGDRPATDFEIAEAVGSEQSDAGLTLAELPNNRRRDLVVLISHLLQDDINELLIRWQGPDSQLHQTYHRLPPGSRIELLKNAAEHYLRQDARELLHSFNTEEQHNTFARRSLEPLLQGLTGLQNLFNKREQGFLNGLNETETGQKWLAQLDQFITQLAELDAEQALEPEAQITLEQQLEQLALLLRPTALDNSLLGSE